MARGSSLILDRYEPVGTAGAGGFGTVQIAWDLRIQRKVAIKVIHLTELDAYRAHLPGAQAVSSSPTADRWHGVQPWNEFLKDGASMREGLSSRGACASPPFEHQDQPWDEGPGIPNALQVTSLAHLPGLDEARTAAMLQDPRIVTVYDFEVRDRMAYLIMEYVEGITLARLLADYPDFLTLDMVAAVFDAVAGALMVAHKAGVLHLDIKPDNVIVNLQGKAKVTDFGLATLADASGAGTTGGGTIGYMPLEQMRREHLDARTDEWSLAAIAYEMLTGDNPFRVPSLDQAESSIENAELVLPSLCWDDLDDQVDDVVFYALDPDREARYASVADFAEEMDKFLGDPARGQEQLALVVADALGVGAGDGESYDDPDAESDDPSARRGLLGWLLGSRGADSPDGCDHDGSPCYEEEYEDAAYGEPVSARRRRRAEKREARAEKRSERRRVLLSRAVFALVGGLATWIALWLLPPVPSAFGLDPLFFNVVASLAVGAISAIAPLPGIAIALVLSAIAFALKML